MRWLSELKSRVLVEFGSIGDVAAADEEGKRRQTQRFGRGPRLPSATTDSGTFADTCHLL